MSTINVETLRELAKDSEKDFQEFKAKKELRRQEHIKTFNNKCDELNQKYFDENDPKSINCSFARAVKKSSSSEVNLYMNFVHADFCGWAKFVPFKADEYGNNYNARPASCLRLYLERAKELGYLPNITFDVWGNKKFTVHFKLQLYGQDDTTEAENSEAENSEYNNEQQTISLSELKGSISDIEIVNNPRNEAKSCSK